MAGEPGLGKTRLVYECRKLFMAWVGAASGRLPLWLEGRAASYASSTPYGLYQQLLAGWVGVAAEEAKSGRPALERAMKAVFGGKCNEDQVDLLAQVMGLGPAPEAPAWPGSAQSSCSGPPLQPSGVGVQAWWPTAPPCSCWRTCTGPTPPRSASPRSFPP